MTIILLVLPAAMMVTSFLLAAVGMVKWKNALLAFMPLLVIELVLVYFTF